MHEDVGSGPIVLRGAQSQRVVMFCDLLLMPCAAILHQQTHIDVLSGCGARDGVVTVSLGYRLGFDGFGHIEGAPSNRGIRDWLAGLARVRENIASSGGDPKRVTIARQSAGGGAIVTLFGME